MSKFRNLICEVFILAESTAKIEYILNNKKLIDKLQQSISMDVEIDDKTMTPADLLTKWDQDPILSKNLNWVAKQYGDMQFYYGDTYKVKEALEKFDKYKNKKALIDNQTLRSNDLNKYSYRILVQDLDQIDDSDITNLGTSTRKKAIEKGKDEAEIAYEDNDWIVIVPKTQAAAMYWGKNTKWCTAADSKNNMFNTYNKKGPLFIAINKNNPKEKYQACFEAGEYKDINDNDNRVPEGTGVFKFLKNEAKNRNALKNYWWWFKEDEITDEMMLDALKKVKIQFGNIDYNSNDICLTVDRIFYNRNEQMSEDFIKKAVTANPKFIRNIDNPSPEVQLIYLNWVWNQIKHRSHEYLFDKDDMYAINNYIQNGLSDEAKAFIEKVKAEEQEKHRQKQTDEYMEYAKDGRLDRIPEEERTYDIYLTAVKAERPYHKVKLDEIPNEFKDRQMYQAYLENNLIYGVLREIPKQYLTKKLCLAAVKANKWNFLDVPDDFKTLEMCKATATNDGYYDSDIWKAIPEQFKPYI